MQPHPDHQYPVEPSATQRSLGFGNDYSYFGLWPNSNTGLTAFQTQGSSFDIAAAPMASGQPVRVTGYGDVTPPVLMSWNRAQKTHTGQYLVFSGTVLGYAVDTTNSNSGSPVVLESTGRAIGIHTSSGCAVTGGNNWGTMIPHPGLQAALANPMGICASGVGTPAGQLYLVGEVNNNIGTVDRATAKFAKSGQTLPRVNGVAYDKANDRFFGTDGQNL